MKGLVRPEKGLRDRPALPGVFGRGIADLSRAAAAEACARSISDIGRSAATTGLCVLDGPPSEAAGKKFQVHLGVFPNRAWDDQYYTHGLSPAPRQGSRLASS